MGFHAPSAEDVYSYVFRLNLPYRTLTDNFGLSIIFVNDTSPICREFLQSFFVDLCHRTADRIRFIFFAGISDGDLTREANDLNRVGPRAGGMLDRILQRISGPSKFDSLYRRYSSWEELRPSALHPVHPENTFEKLGWVRDLNSSVPGVGESLRFAQRMGIGRHVPCFVIFTDVGGHQIDLMPIGHMSPAEIYGHVRRWIDDYYELNRTTLDNWKRVEEEIQSVRSEFEISLTKIRDWGNLNVRVWETLRTCNQVIVEVEHLTHESYVEWMPALQRMRRYEHLPDTYTEAFGGFFRTIDRNEVSQHKYETVQALCDDLNKAQTFDAVFNSFHKVKTAEVRFPEVTDPLHLYMDQMLERQRRRKLDEPESELLGWWSRASRATPSFGDYRSIVEAEVNRTSPQALKEEFKVLLTKVRQLPISVDPEQGSLSVVKDLYPEEIDRQKRSVDQLATKLKSYLDVVASCPGWMMSEMPSLPIGEAIPWKGGTPGKKIFDALPEESPIRNLVFREQQARSNIHDFAEDDRFAASCKSAMLPLVAKAGSQYHVTDKDWTMSLSAFNRRLRQLRTEVEAEVYKAADALLLSSKDIGLKLNKQEVERLQQAMKTYQAAVDSLRLPHKRTPP